jgi:GNAT superfamily N-acetyltransferase
MQHAPLILLVQPPMHHPGYFSDAYRHAAGILEAMALPCAFFHAGMDFVFDYLMTPEIIETLSDRVRRRMAEGHYVQADAETAGVAASLIDTPQSWATLFEAEAVRRCRVQLQSSAFFDLTLSGQALQLLDRILALVSTAFFPAVLDRRGFSCGALQDEIDVARFVDDALRNPFLTYARHHCRPPKRPGQCERVLFIVDSAGQLPGMVTLARVWRNNCPELQVDVSAVEDDLQRAAERLLNLPSSFSAAAQVTTRMRKAIAAGTAPTWTEDGRPALLLPETCAGKSLIGIVQGALQPESMAVLLEGAAAAQAGVVEWRDPAGDVKAITRLLYQSSQKGFWNHLLLPQSDSAPATEALARFAVANPNIVHSWCRCSESASFVSDARRVYPPGNPPYGGTRPLPGVPVWQRLQDPVYLRACQERWGTRELSRMFLLDDDRALHLAGSGLAYAFVSPEQLPPGYLEEICEMVAAGGSVQAQWVRHNLERAYLIAYAEENGVIVGCYSLKHPREAYIAAVSLQSGIDLRHYLERGYASVRPEYRSLGIGARLMEGLTQRARAGQYKVFSVIAEDNVGTQKMAMRKGTRKVATYFSERAQKRVGVWIPEEMLPQGITLPEQPDLE